MTAEEKINAAEVKNPQSLRMSAARKSGLGMTEMEEKNY
jgi:hypothetical protein